jgi:hypothetical protein
MSALKHRNELTAINIITAVAAALLLFSPWLFGFSGEQVASWNAWIIGLLIVAKAFAAVVELQEWEEWINLVLGLWVAVSPWLLGFTGVHNALWTHVGVGIAVAILAAVELWMIHQSPRATA